MSEQSSRFSGARRVGAAAAALYGSRANNGVVQIFTKRGTSGKPRFTSTTRWGTSQLREQQPFNFYAFDVSGLPNGLLAALVRLG